MCPADYLQWMAEKLADSDLYLWAQAARDELDARRTEGQVEADRKSLEQQADDILRKGGLKP